MSIVHRYSRLFVCLALVSFAIAACSKSKTEKPAEQAPVVEESAPAPVVEPAPAEKPVVEAPKAETPKPKPVDPEAEAAAAAARVAAAEKAAAEKAAAEEAARIEAAAAEAARVEAARIAAEKKAAADEAARAEAAKAEAARVEAARIAAEKKAAADEAARAEAAKAEAARVEAARIAAEKKAAADEAARAEAAKAEAARVEAARVAAAEKAALEEAARIEADRLAAALAAEKKLAAEEAARAEAARLEEEQRIAEEKALAIEAARTEAERIEAARIDAEKAAAAKAEAERLAAARTKAEAERIAALVVPEPAIKSPGGVFSSPIRVSISVNLKEAVIYYTLDGSEPSENNGNFYIGPFTVRSSTVVKARGVVPKGQSSKTATAGFAIGEVFVAPGGSGDGRLGGPSGRIGEAISKARALNIGTVKLSSGTFEDSIDVIVGGVLISGGWKADFSARATERTVIRARVGGKTSRTAPSYAIKVSGALVTDRARFERIEFQGAKATYSAGILVTESASPQFIDCAAFAGPSNYGYGAMVSANASPTFRYCRLDGGGGATSYGLSVDGANSTVELSFLLAGTGSVGGYGVVGTNALVTVSSSVMAGNSANVSYGAAFYNCKNAVLKNSTIVGGSGQDVAGVFVSISEPSIEDCVISANGVTKSVGVHANYGDSTPARLAGNVFLGCASGLYWTAAKRLAYAKLNAAGAIIGPSGENVLRGDSVDNMVGSFTLGAPPAYEIPSSAGVRAGAASITFH
jgi:hypothetical protein